MKQSGAYLTVYALEQIGVQKTFGIPGTHNIEIYNQLNNSLHIEAVLVTHEGAGAYMADAASRTTDSIGTMVVGPAAGVTQAITGIAAAKFDGIPMLVISGGIRRDNNKSYKLHQLDLGKMLDGIVKKYTLVKSLDEIIPNIFEAYKIAMEGEPGPVFIEIPEELQTARKDVGSLLKFPGLPKQNLDDNNNLFDIDSVKRAVELLLKAKNPGIYVGWGAVDAFEETKKIAELLGAPVSTTFQGLCAFPANHPLHTSIGYGAMATPAGQNAFKNCDCLLAVGLRFSELATNGFRLQVPDNMIHIDINPKVFNKNYNAKITIEGDAKLVLTAIIKELESRGRKEPVNYSKLSDNIKNNKLAYKQSWLKKVNEHFVSPGFFFNALRNALNDDAIVVTDVGNPTYYTSELFPVHKPGQFICPTDFNCMGYGVPATIAAKFMNKSKQVIGIVDGGAFIMSGLELVTAFTYKLGVIIFVFHNSELGAISQFQESTINHKDESIISEIDVKGVTEAVHAQHIQILNDIDTSGAIKEALMHTKQGENVVIDVNIDYSRKTYLAQGKVKTNMSRFPVIEKIRMLIKAGKRHIVE